MGSPRAQAADVRSSLTGGGRDDYIVDFRDTNCEGREATYCGTGGCVMDILVTLPNGSVRRVFDGYVRNYQIKPKPMKAGAVRSIRFELHGGYCGGHGSPQPDPGEGRYPDPLPFHMP